MSSVLITIALCGIGTFLLRWLPLWQARKNQRSAPNAARLQKWLTGVGPAAIAALLTVSLWGQLSTDARPGRVAMLVIALACTAITRRMAGGGIALPTLVGAIAYGLLSYLGL
ncbi:branched-chain amino acid transport [Lampropedia aestuarii]|uniref:Branched-chain amino acid transport n=1 Tax=Lampropedia aestuarii TaxID=2562762 RepID=A0A4S5BVM6_9BURK|nr:AzlD domain-containing protein [Lampropedia aestuarii]MDH5859123.1 AzlD domain-containing protein [Lampropedia aestuarii]THJ36579.1 branched-chain amino acid transport [Lampropedia aestuarii]